MTSLITISIDTKILELFRDYCDKNKLKYSAVVSELIEKFIKKKDK